MRSRRLSQGLMGGRQRRTEPTTYGTTSSPSLVTRDFTSGIVRCASTPLEVGGNQLAAWDAIGGCDDLMR